MTLLALVAVVCCAPWWVSYEQAAVSISNGTNSVRYDWTNSSLRTQIFQRPDPRFNRTFYISIFDPLNQSEVPSYINWSEWGAELHSNVIRCDDSVQQCFSVSTIYDYFWMPTDEKNLSAGMIWSAQGDPLPLGDGDYDEWSVRVALTCGSGLANVYIDSTSGYPTVYVALQTREGCPIADPNPPTQTPAPTPRCFVDWRDPKDPTFGLIADLNDLNNGRFGYTTLLINSTSVSHPTFLLWQPCDVAVACPWGAECDAPNSSAWLCRTSPTDVSVLSSCSGFGLRSTNYDNTSFHLTNGTDLTQGFYYDFDSQNGHNTRIYLSCEENYPEGHILVDWRKSQTVGLNLTIYGRATEFCAKEYPTPMPVVGCDLFYNETGANYSQDPTNVWTLNLTLSDYDNATRWNGTEYWNFTVTRRQPFLDTYDVLYSPCGRAVPCPSGYDCDGDGEAYVYLCEIPTTARIGFCTAYGLPKFNITASLRYDNMFEGAVIQYRARHTRHVHVFWLCGNTTEPGRLDPGGWLAVDGSQIAFEVFALEACPTGQGPTPSPSPRFPPRPPATPSVDPPTPISSPNPVRVLSNQTHYIAVDLRTLQGPWPLEVQQTVLVNSHHSLINTFWYAWDGLACPPGWGGCYGGIDGFPWNGTANLFECWITDDYQPYCHAVATKWLPGYDVSNLKQFDLESPLAIFYPGTWGTHMEIIATCDPDGPRNDLGIDEDAVVIWQVARGGQEFTFETHSNVACPRQFQEPRIPTAKRPTPSPNVTMQYSIDQIGPDGKEHRLDLRVLKDMYGSVILGYGENFYRAEIHYSPWQTVACPDGRNCSAYQDEIANVWNCVGPDLADCFPIGDVRYGVLMSQINDSDPASDIMARYNGGAGNFRVVFQFSCDPLLAPNDVTFSEIGMQNPPTMSSTTVFVFAAVADMCPQDPNPSQAPPPTPSISIQTPKQSPSPAPSSLPTSSRLPASSRLATGSPSPSPSPSLSVIPRPTVTPPPERRKATGGAIFLIIVFILAVGYFGVGAVIIYFTTGTVAVPNEAFWLEVWESIMTVVLLVFTCGRDEKVTGPIYDRV